MDAFARGLKIAAAIRDDGVLENFVKDRYASWDSGIGAEIEKGKAGFKTWRPTCSRRAKPPPTSPAAWKCWRTSSTNTCNPM